MDNGSAVHGLRSVRLLCVRPRLAHQAADARADGIRRLLQANAGPPRSAQGAADRGRIPQGWQSMGWTVLPSAPARMTIAPRSAQADCTPAEIVLRTIVTTSQGPPIFRARID